jgi:predicted transcriptional regulator
MKFRQLSIFLDLMIAPTSRAVLIAIAMEEGSQFDLARRAQLSSAEAKVALMRLVKLGIVSSRQQGRTRIYSVNRAFVDLMMKGRKGR